MAHAALVEVMGALRRFVSHYRELFPHKAQRRHFAAYLRGLIGPLARKSIEPIALEQGGDMRRLQDFIGTSPWDAEALLVEPRRHVRDTLGSPHGILILDPTAFPQRGDKSVGVARQWCGQQGPEENCVVGVTLGDAAEQGHTFRDRRLYLPRAWAEDLPRRCAAGVPADVVFRTSWELAYEMIAQVQHAGFPHAWISGDEEFGKVPQFQDWLAQDGERYILEGPCHTRVWVALPRGRRRGPQGLVARLRRRGPGRPRLVRVDTLARELPPPAWTVHAVRDARKGPIRVRAALMRLGFHRRKQGERPEGWLLVTQTVDQRCQTPYFQRNAAADMSMVELLRAGFARWPVEQCHGQGKNETGLGDYETRAWRGWHHHTGLSFLAHHWLVLSRNRLGEKIPGDDGRGGAASLLPRVTPRAGEAADVRPTDAAPAAPQPYRAVVTLEASPGATHHQGAAEAGRCRPCAVGHHSNSE